MPDHGPALLASLALAGMVAASACDTAPAPIHTIHTDSAGIPIVTAVVPLWGRGDEWTVEAEPLVEIGTVSGAPEYRFSEVVAAVRLGNGDIVVADRGASELRSYDAAGNFQWRQGRFGEGPGEFESLDFLGTTASDSLVTYDESLLRIQLFDSAGGLARTLRVELPRGTGAPGGSAPDKAVGVVEGRLVLRFIELADEAGTGIVRWVNDRAVAIDLSGGSAVSLVVVGGEEVEMKGGETSSVAFGNMPEFAASAGRVAVIDTEAYAVRLISPLDGAIERIVRREVAPRAVTDAVLETHLDGIGELAAEAGAPAERLDFIRKMWRDMPRAQQLPVLRSVHLDAAGNLWLAPYYVAGADPPPFEIHAPDGIWLGSVALPPGLQRAFIQYQAPYMEIGEDYALGVWTDDLDVQYVRMYRINK